MTNQEILTKAIEKAIAGGWNEFGKLVDVVLPVSALNTVWMCSFKDAPDGKVRVYNYQAVIFNKGFAKALWPNYLDCDCAHESCECGCYVCTGWERLTKGEIYEWQHHLQRMVIADDPIKYLGENI